MEHTTPDDERKRAATKTITTCRGNFWRNTNRDRGQFALVVEEEDGAPTSAVLTLGWDRWEEEVLVLKERAQTLRFEGGLMER